MKIIGFGNAAFRSPVAFLSQVFFAVCFDSETPPCFVLILVRLEALRVVSSYATPDSLVWIVLRPVLCGFLYCRVGCIPSAVRMYRVIFIVGGQTETWFISSAAVWSGALVLYIRVVEMLARARGGVVILNWIVGAGCTITAGVSGLCRPCIEEKKGRMTTRLSRPLTLSTVGRFWYDILVGCSSAVFPNHMYKSEARLLPLRSVKDASRPYAVARAVVMLCLSSRQRPSPWRDEGALCRVSVDGASESPFVWWFLYVDCTVLALSVEQLPASSVSRQNFEYKAHIILLQMDAR